MYSATVSDDFQHLFEAGPGLSLVLRPDRTIFAASDAYLSAMKLERIEILGRDVFDVLPAYSDTPQPTCVGNLRASLDRVASEGVEDVMPVLNWDTLAQEPDGAGFAKHSWTPVNTPIFSKGRVSFIVHRVEDVTETVRLIELQTEQIEVAQCLRSRIDRLVTDGYRQSQVAEEAARLLQVANQMLDRVVGSGNELRTGPQDRLDQPITADELMARIGRSIVERKELQARAALTESANKAFLQEVLLAVTEGKLKYCGSKTDLPDECSQSDRIPLSADSIHEVRTAASDAAANCAIGPDRIADLNVAVSEAATNAITHARGGAARVCRSSGGTVQVWIEDTGGGIDVSQLHRAALEKGYSTAGTMGVGFFLMLNCIDRLHLFSTCDGTVVVLEMDRIPPAPAWLTARLAES